MHIFGMERFKDITSQMIWRGSALAQIDRFEEILAALGSRLRFQAEVVSSHRSKSIDLPVIQVTTDAGSFVLRDNFNDVNIMATLKSPATLPLAEFFAGLQEPRTWDWYLTEIERARNYSWRAWTDEEMNDPRILRVRDKRPGVDLWWTKPPEEKDRWAARMSNPAWYSRDWSSGELTWDGSFGPGVLLFVQGHAFGEGINVTTSNRKYLRGLSDFIIAVDSLQTAGSMIERLTTVGVS